jgi:hypothetical protein
MADWSAAFAAQLSASMGRLSRARSPIDMLTATVGTFSRAIRTGRMPWNGPVTAGEAAGGLMGAVVLANTASNAYTGVQDAMAGDYSGALMGLGTAAGWYFGGRWAMGSIGRYAAGRTYPGARREYVRSAREEFIKKQGQAEYEKIMRDVMENANRRREAVRKMRAARNAATAHQTAQNSTQGVSQNPPPGTTQGNPSA